MVLRVEPLLHGVESLPERGAYLLTLIFPDQQKQTVIAKITDEAVTIPAASMVRDWPEDSESYQQMTQTLLAFEATRQAVTGQVQQLRDVPGGWDVAIGNVILNADGKPTCADHGVMEQIATRCFCEECKAQAIFG